MHNAQQLTINFCNFLFAASMGDESCKSDLLQRILDAQVETNNRLQSIEANIEVLKKAMENAPQLDTKPANMKKYVEAKAGTLAAVSMVGAVRNLIRIRSRSPEVISIGASYVRRSDQCRNRAPFPLPVDAPKVVPVTPDEDYTVAKQ